MNTEWMHRAVCRDVDPELFFPAAEDGALYDLQVEAAKAVCARCPVRVECLTLAMDQLPYGVAGGLSEQERRGARRGARDGGPSDLTGGAR